MSDATLLNIVLFLPLLGAGLLLVSPTAHDDFTRRLALALMTLQFVLTAWLYLRFDSADAGPAVRHPRAVDRKLGRALPRRAATATTSCW